ncbi:MAG: DUF58 domain-containing protein [Deltaproteobacteria bacterium]|nr:DUF58 domain-containing protein [Deltaproteobacteria bacterium]
MTPGLSTRGRYVTVVSLVLVVAGTLATTWTLVALGMVALSALLVAVLWFYPTAIYYRRRKVELSWWLETSDQPGGMFTPQHPLSLRIAVRNHSPRDLRVREISPILPTAWEGIPLRDVLVPRGHEVEAVVTLRALAPGNYVLHGAMLRTIDLCGLLELTSYFPNPLSLKVFPKMALPQASKGLMKETKASREERIGVHHVRHRGRSGDVRELREHVAGDPFKLVAWKATARRGKLMVRELESEIVLTHQIVLDIGGSMRAGAPGTTRLDHAVELSAALARAALDGGDRVGLVTFDTTVHGALLPDEGRPHFLRLMDRLIEVRHVASAESTDLTDGELVAAVARYLFHQESVDVRVRSTPPKGDPAWEKLATGPTGELYDLAAMMRVVDTLLSSRVRPSGHDTAMARLRRLCVVRGIELPYRMAPTPSARSSGLAAALTQATRGQRSQVVVVSDLEGILEEPAEVLRALSMAHKWSKVACLIPPPPRMVEGAHAELSETVYEVLSGGETRRVDALRRAFLAVGSPVVAWSAGDKPEEVLRRIRRPRGIRADAPRAAHRAEAAANAAKGALDASRSPRY